LGTNISQKHKGETEDDDTIFLQDNGKHLQDYMMK